MIPISEKTTFGEKLFLKQEDIMDDKNKMKPDVNQLQTHAKFSTHPSLQGTNLDSATCASSFKFSHYEHSLEDTHNLAATVSI